MNYIEAEKILGKRSKKKLGNHTYLRRSGDELIIRLYATDIIVFRPGEFSLNAGIWRTNTTQKRINTYAPLKVYSKKGVWYVAENCFKDYMTFFEDDEGNYKHICK